MGALNSSAEKEIRPNRTEPSSVRKCGTIRRNRLFSLIGSKCFTGKLANFRWRRKCRQLSREDHRAFCALISRWTSTELAAMLTEMESAWAVRELMLIAEKARPAASILAGDLLSVWQNEQVRYAVHSIILRARCRYFSDLWDSMVASQSEKTTLEISFVDNSISLELFKAMLYYMYTGEYEKSLRGYDRQLLNAILQRYGCGSSLSGDLTAFDPEKMDCTLIFTRGNREEGNQDRDYRLKCSAVILAARSSYLRSLVEKRISCGKNLEIAINEHLFPRNYSHVVLDALYTDRLDLSKVLEGRQMSTSSLSEVQAIASGQRHLAPLRHAIEIFHIAQFLSLPQLAHACEDIIVSQISAEAIGSLWNWASQSGGSAYVRRHCIAHLRSEFSRICSSQFLFELEEELLRNCLLSDYVQCAEVEILETVIRWGEHELVRRMEECEPNLIANTIHSITRKGIHRSELNDKELKSILVNLLPLVRIDYILPPFHQSLNVAYKRGLLDRSPHMDLLGQHYPYSRSPDVNPDAHWFDHSVPRRHAAGPRFLLPYVVESREQLERLCRSGDDGRTLNTLKQKVSSADTLQIYVDVLSPEIISECTKLKIEKRVKELSNDELVNKAISCGCPHHLQLAIDQLRLRVLRELNINEECVKVFCNSSASKRNITSFYNSSRSPFADVSDSVKVGNYHSSTALSNYDNENGSSCLPDVLQNEVAL